MEKLKITQPAQYEIENVIYENQANKRAFYKVRASALGMFYGLKTIEVEDNREARVVRNEIVALNRLPFGMSPKCHQYWQQGNKHFLLTDWIEGVPLSETYKEPPQSQMDLAQRLKVVEMLAWKVSGLHKHRIYHRDLKPDNVIVQSRGGNVQSASLIDFGLSNQKRASEEGTYLYQAPEQYLQRNVSLSEASDVFSLCQIIHWIVVGSPRLLEPNLNNDDWDSEPNIELPKFCPSSLKKMLEKGLSFNPRQRIKQASTVGQELKQILRKLNSRGHR